MEKTVTVLEDDLRTLRAGRASAELLNSLPVEAYGGSMLIQQVASVANSDNGGLVVQVWDATLAGAVEKAIRDSQLGFSVVNDGTNLRLSMPPLSQERRLELVKVVNQKGEAARIQLRQIRSDAHQQASKEKQAGAVREDELNRLIKELNEMIDQYNQRVKVIVEHKEKELMTI